MLIFRNTNVLKVFLVVAFLFGVIVYRVILKSILYNIVEIRAYSSTIISVTAATINLILILILGKFYSWLAVKLTDIGNNILLPKVYSDVFLMI